MKKPSADIAESPAKHLIYEESRLISKPMASYSNNSAVLDSEDGHLANGKSELTGTETANQNQPEKSLEDDSSKAEEVKVKFSWRNYTLDPFMFLYTFANFMASAVTPNLYMDRACAVNLNYSSDICSNLSGNPIYEDEVQIYANNVSLYAAMIGIFPGAIWAILVGPWSDLYGRVPFTALALVGGALQALGFALFVHLDHLSVYYALLASVPGGISGGIVIVMSAVYCLVADTSDPKMRALKYGIIQGVYSMGMALAGLIAGQIYAHYSYLPVFLTQFGLTLICLFWLLLAISDQRPNKKVSDLKTKIKDFFSIQSLKENLQTCLRKREDHGRSQLWLLMGSLCSFFIISNGTITIDYLFCNKMYGWGVPFYTMVRNVSLIAAIVVMIFAVVIMIIRLRIRDATLGLIGTISQIGQGLAKAFAYTPGIYYIALALGGLLGLGPMSIKSRISKIIPQEEIGKVMSIVATLENLMPIPGTPIFTIIYNSSVSYYPGLSFLCTAIVVIPPLVVFIWLMLKQSKPVIDQEVLQNEDDFVKDGEVKPEYNKTVL